MSDYDALTTEQRMVVDLYVDGAISMQDAVIEAGYAEFEGFTPHQVAMRLLASPRIQAAIKERSEVVHEQGVANTFWYLRRLIDYLNCDYTKIFHENGAPMHPARWPKELRMMVRKVKMDEMTGAVTEVQFEPKTKIFEMVGRTDLVGAFAGESKAGEVIINITRDFTTVLESNEERLVDQIPASDTMILDAEATQDD